MNVLSLFDGISAGQLALERTRIKYDNYFASEIDKYAIKITQKNFPKTVQLGDICDWKSWDLPKIDLIIGGSPCQGFSIAGAGLNFDDPRSKLFFVFVEILNFYKPEYFLLENVKMKKEWEEIISNSLGVNPILINSSLVSAQSRKRLYWTNIPNIQQPKDKEIFLKDVVESGDVDRDKSYCIDANYFKGGSLKTYFDKSRRQIVIEKPYQSSKRLMVKEKSYTILKRKKEGLVVGNIYPSNGQNGNIYSTEGKSPSLCAGIGIVGNGIGSNNAPKIQIKEKNKTLFCELENISWRKLSPTECERLQTIPDGYTEGISNTQRYKCLGNSWTVDVISHIFSYIPINELSIKI